MICHRKKCFQLIKLVKSRRLWELVILGTLEVVRPHFQVYIIFRSVTEISTRRGGLGSEGCDVIKNIVPSLKVHRFLHKKKYFSQKFVIPNFEGLLMWTPVLLGVFTHYSKHYEGSSCRWFKIQINISG